MFTLLFYLCRNVELNGIFHKYYGDGIVVVEASSSGKQEFNGSRKLTHPEFIAEPVDNIYDWFSHCARDNFVKPWITFSLKFSKIKFNGFFIRCGCCNPNICCCEDDAYGCFDCCLYTFKLQISDDNETWKDIFEVKQDITLQKCMEKTYKLDKYYTAKYVRLYQFEAKPGETPCMALNRIEFFGDADGANPREPISQQDDDEDISIIGHISKSFDERVKRMLV